MFIKLTKMLLLQLLLLILLVSCSRTTTDAIDENQIQDAFSILSIVDMKDGKIAFFERSTYKDVGVAFIDSSMSKEKTGIGGYLQQNHDLTNWHYSSSDINGKPYAVYYGTLDSPPTGKVFINLGVGNPKEAAVLKTSSATVWYLILEERIEVNELQIEVKE